VNTPIALLVFVGLVSGCGMDTPGGDAVRPGGDEVASAEGIEAANPPFQQAENKTDVDITAEIRRQVLDHPDLGVQADNATITTEGGVVTLRGKVDSDAEKMAIEQIARGVSGVTQVRNELDVSSLR
jgi:osmotically-inducible protein OsmY